MSSCILFFALIFSETTLHAQESFWQITNRGAEPYRLQEVQEALQKCKNGLRSYFDIQPQKLVVYLYGTRAAFVKDLQDIHHFSKETASYFQESSAPRPLVGNFLVPPDQKMQNVCHEVVHHYLESYTSRDQLLNAKWFDEGTADFLASQIFNSEQMEKKKHFFLKNSKGKLIPLASMQIETAWNALHKDKKTRSVSYVQASLMMEYFFEKYSTKTFLGLLRDMRDQPFEKAFKKKCKISSKKFYKEWGSSPV